MAYKIQAAFGAGELDPALHERTTLDKYRTGLATLRNCHVGKTGRLITRAGKPKLAASRVVTTSAGTFTAATTDICTKVGHFMHTGATVTVSSTTTLPAGLVAATTYYVIYLTEDTFKLASTLEEAYQSNAVDITSTGAGTHTITPTDVGERVVTTVYSPRYSQYLLEFGHCFVRIHDTSAGTSAIGEGHGFHEDDIPDLHFVSSGIYTYISLLGKPLRKIVTSTGALLAHLGTSSTTGLEFYPAKPTFVSQVLNGTGYAVDYVFTYVNGMGQESNPTVSTFAALLPAAATPNTYVFDTSTDASNIELRVYRRPVDGNAYGFIGSTSTKVLSGSLYRFTFTDYGGDADYTHTFPQSVISTQRDLDPSGLTYPTTAWLVNRLRPRTVTVYQGRLVVSSSYNEESIVTSRSGYHYDFNREYPLSAASALAFKAGTTGSAKVLRMMDNDGMLAFTTVGIYRSSGALTPDNLALDKISNHVIDPKVPPLEVPGGILFVDASTNSVRNLTYSNESKYPSEEVSIFSNHLFKSKRVVSWAFQDGEIPLVWVVFDDGSLISLTYQREQQMQAWSRHDTSNDTLYEAVVVVKSLTAQSVAYFITNRGGVRTIEYTAPRTVTDLKDFVGMDAAVTFNGKFTAEFTAAPLLVETWDGQLRITTTTAGTFSAVLAGDVLKFFESDGAAVNLTVDTVESATSLVVTPDVLFPLAEATDFTELYTTYTTLTGLDHLDGLHVSVLADGYVVSSPFNEIDDLDILMVESGSLTIPDTYANSAIVQVGLPYVCDIETLDVDTVEQKPTLIESVLASRIHLKVHDSRGGYISSSFGPDDTNIDMVDPETRLDDDGDLTDMIGNACQKPYTRRMTFDIPGDWQSHGRVCIRQVDPLPLEILSLIPDLEIHRS